GAIVLAGLDQAEVSVRATPDDICIRIRLAVILPMADRANLKDIEFIERAAPTTGTTLLQPFFPLHQSIHRPWQCPERREDNTPSTVSGAWALCSLTLLGRDD